MVQNTPMWYENDFPTLSENPYFEDCWQCLSDAYLCCVSLESSLSFMFGPKSYKKNDRARPWDHFLVFVRNWVCIGRYHFNSHFLGKSSFPIVLLTDAILCNWIISRWFVMESFLYDPGLAFGPLCLPLAVLWIPFWLPRVHLVGLGAPVDFFGPSSRFRSHFPSKCVSSTAPAHKI